MHRWRHILGRLPRKVCHDDGADCSRLALGDLGGAEPIAGTAGLHFPVAHIKDESLVDSGTQQIFQPPP